MQQYNDDDYKAILSKNINYFLELNSKTQSDLVNDLKFDKSTVSTWCNGKKLPRMDKIDALCEYFSITRSDLIEDHKEKRDRGDYYLNTETKRIAQEIYENKDMRVLFDVAMNTSPERLRAYAEFLKNLQDKDNM